MRLSKLGLIVQEPRTSRCSSWIWKLQRNQRSNYQHLLDHRKSKRFQNKHLLLHHWQCRSQQTVENSEKDGNTRPPHVPPEKPVCRSRSKLEPEMEQQTTSKLGKEYIKAVYCHAAYLTYCRVHHAICRAGWTTRWNQDCQEKYQSPQICRGYLLWQKVKRN